MGPGAVLRGLVQRVIPLRFADDRDTDRPARLGPFGDLKVESAFSTEHLLADEGSYFIGNHASPGGGGTLGTALTFGLPAVAAVVGNAAAMFAIYNSDNPISQGGFGKSVCPRKITIWTEEATVPATTTAVAWAIVVDPAPRQPTANAGGPFSPVNVNGNSPMSSVSRIYYCNAASGLTLPAAGPAARTAGFGYFKVAASVTKDIYELQFGGIDPASLYTQAVTVAQRYVEKAPPVLIGPQQWGIVYLAMPGAATNNVTYEFSMDLVER